MLKYIYILCITNLKCKIFLKVKEYVKKYTYIVNNVLKI